jgi:uncharacterized cupredoxin-like copper-binding protein
MPYPMDKTMNNWRSRLPQLLGLWLAMLIWLGAPAAAVSIDLAKQPIIALNVSLGTPDGALKFVPNHFEFQSGQRYQLTLTNPSPMKHYFTAKDFADSIWSQKVDAGPVEIKGAIHELEIRPGGTANWVFVPLKTGTYELHCAIAGHSAAGMTGTITIAVKGLSRQ